MAPMFSSIQAPPQTPETQPKLKGKSATADSSKKRKREEQADGGAEAMDGSTVKKTKKRKSEAATPVETDGAGEAASSEAQEVPEKSAKKVKKRKSEAVVESRPVSRDGDVPVVAATSNTEGKSDGKKRKASEEPVTDAAVTEASAKKQKKSKKDRRSISVEVAEGAPLTATPSATPAKKPKPRKPRPSRANGDPSTVAEAGPSNTQHTTTSHDEDEAPTPEDIDTDQLLRTQSPFSQVTTTFYLALSPCANDFPLEGLIAEHIAPLLLQYYPPLRGVVMRYSNARLSEHPEITVDEDNADSAVVVLSKAIDEYAVTFIYLIADFVLFRPGRGTWLEGYVNLQNESLLGIICYNYFNAGIERQYLPKNWRWVEDQTDVGRRTARQGNGYWVDGDGKKVEGRVAFRVRDFEASGGEGGVGSVGITGTMVSEADERRVEGGA